MGWEVVASLMGIGLILIMFAGVPIGVTLGLAGLVPMLLILGPERTSITVSQEVAGLWTNYSFLALPLFVLMGELLVFAGTGEDIFEMASKWLSPIPGSLGVVTVATCAVFATLSGSSVAATSAIGSIAVPQMLDRGYSKRLATGVVASAGALAHLIPPSVLGVIYAAITDVSVGRMFMAGLVPGLLLAGCFALIAITWAIYNSASAPLMTGVTWRDRFVVLKRAFAPILIVVVVLGSIYTGAATVNESAAMGVVASFLLCVLTGRLNFPKLRGVLLAAAKTTSFVMIIATGAKLFAWSLTYYLIPQRLTEVLTDAVSNPYMIVALIMFAYFIMGMFIDPLGIMLITVPIVVPMLVGLGFDPIWFGVLYLINMEMAYVTPPLGFNLYIIKGVVGDRVPLSDIIWGSTPFLIADAVVIILVIIFPQIALWLPSQMGS